MSIPVIVPLANIGLPMIGLHWPMMILLLPVVVLIETLAAKPILKTRFWPATGYMLIANLASTILGIPIAWFLMVVVNGRTSNGYDGFMFNSPWEFFSTIILRGSWLYPDMNKGWMFAAATLGMMLPYFIMSFLSEWAVMRLMIRTVKSGLIWKAAWRANFASYTFIIALCIYWLIHEIDYAL